MDRNLRIRMLLEASDRVTRPLRDMASGATRTGRAFKATRDRLKELDRAQADIQSFRSLKAGLRTTEAQLTSAKGRVAELARAIDSADAPTRKLTRDFDNAKRAAAALKGQHAEESAELQRIRERMAAAGISTSKLATHERDLRGEIARTNTELEEQSRRLKTADDRARRFAAGREQFGRIQGAATGLAAGGFSAIETGRAIGRPVLGSIGQAQEYQSTMTDIAQKANMARDQGEKMGRGMLAAARAANRLPSEIQAGVDTLMGFGLDPKSGERMMKPIGRAATAYKAEIADLAAASFAGVDNLKVPVEQTGRMLDVMAAAGKAGAFEMKDMAQYFPTLSAGYQALGQKGVPAIADLAAALQIARKGAGDSATAATNVANLLQKISSPATNKAFAKFGVDLPAALKKAYAEGKTPIEAISALVQKTLKGDLSKLGYLFEDAQVQQALRPLIANLDEYRRIRAEAANAGGTVDRDFAERMADSAEQTRRLKVNAAILGTTLGTLLLPAVNAVAAKAASFAERFAAWADRNPGWAKGIAITVASLAALFMVLGAGAIAIAGVLAPFAALRFVTTALNMRPLLAAGGVLRWFFGLFGTLGRGLLVFAQVALPILGRGLLMLGSTLMRVGLMMLANPIFLAIAAIAGAAYLIYSYWGPISGFFQSLWSGITGIVGGAISGLKTLLIAFNPMTLLSNGFNALIGWLRGSMVGKLLSCGADLIRGLISGITGMLGKLKDSIVGAASSAASWFKSKLGIKSPSRVFAGFGGHIIEGLNVGIDRRRREPVQRIEALSRAVIGAIGVGAAASGSPTLAQTAQSPRAGSAPSETHHHWNITQKPGESAEDLAKRIEEILRRIERERSAVARSSMRDAPDGGDA